MVTPTAADVVLVPFPFSDLSASKLRPALVLASAGRGDWICAQITSKGYGDAAAIELDAAVFSTGNLHRSSFVRPGKLFTANESLFRRQVATLAAAKHGEVVDAIVALIRSGA